MKQSINTDISKGSTTYILMQLKRIYLWAPLKLTAFIQWINSFMAEVSIIRKPAHWFPQQIQWAGFYVIRTSVMKELMAKVISFCFLKVWIRRASYLNETCNLLIFIYPKNLSNPNRLNTHTHTHMRARLGYMNFRVPWNWNNPKNWDDVIL